MPARLTISFDFELGWGVLESPLWRQRQVNGWYTGLRDRLPVLFAYLNQAEIATTWGVVSGLLVDREADLQVDHLPPGYRSSVLEFYRSSSRESRFGAELVEQLIALEGLVDIASHSASHFYPNHPEATQDACVQDILISIAALEQWTGRSIPSVIFPRDQVGWCSDVAALHRGNYRVNPTFLNNSIGLGKGYFGQVPEAVCFSGRNAETWQSGSFFFNWPAGWGRELRRRRLMNQVNWVKRRIARQEGDYHLWLHPFNLVGTDGLFAFFMDFLEVIARFRDQGVLEIETMASRGDMSRSWTLLSAENRSHQHFSVPRH